MFTSILRCCVALALCALVRQAFADDVIKNGHDELENGFRQSRPGWPLRGLHNLPNVWADQALKADPSNLPLVDHLRTIKYGSSEYADELQKRYGLYFDPRYPNDGLPLALTKTDAGFDISAEQDQANAEPGFTINCRSCHAGTLFTKDSTEHHFVEGISNVFFDFERFNADVLTAAKIQVGTLFKRNPDRNSMVNAADYFGRLLTYVRQPYPEFDRFLGLQMYYGRFRMPRHRHLENDVQSYLKTQYWVNVNDKLSGTENKGLYVDGGFYGNPSSIMYGMAFSLDPKGKDFLAADQRFAARGIPYLRTVQPPRYPFLDTVDSAQADRGAATYTTACSGCHGTYAKTVDKTYELTHYPGKVIALDKIGTDPFRANDTGFGGAALGNSWLEPNQLEATHGYKAPPLHGIWARAPYLHNASVPTLRQLMRSNARMARYALQPFPNDPNNYDQENLGWKVVELKTADEVQDLRKRDPYVRIYDPDQYAHGLANTGHAYGDKLSDAEVTDLIAFLKLL